MKKLAFFMSVLLLCSIQFTAISEGTLKMAVPYDLDETFRYEAGYSKNGDVWTMEAYEIQPLFSYLNVSSKSSSANIVGFYFALSGNSQTGVLKPVMHVFYRTTQALDAFAASMIIDGIRYDFEGIVSPFEREGFLCKVLSIPMDMTGWQCWEQLTEVSSLQILLYGERTVSMNIGVNENPKQVQDYVSNACMNAAKQLYKRIIPAELDHYSLWELTNSSFERQFERKFRSRAFEDSIMPIHIGDTGSEVKALEELLSHNGFFVGPSDNSFDARTSQAVKLSQSVYGLPETGAADTLLISMLKGEITDTYEKEADASLTTDVGGIKWDFRKWWVASSVYASQTDSILGSFSSADVDHVLLIVSGNASNISDSELINSAVVTLDCELLKTEGTIYFENNDNSAFSTVLFQSSAAKSLIVFEIPETAFKASENFHFTITDGVDTYTLSLD